MSWTSLLKDSLLGNTSVPKEGDSELLESSDEEAVLVSQEEDSTNFIMVETFDGVRTDGTDRGALFDSLHAKLRAHRIWIGRWIKDLDSCLTMLDKQGPSASRQVERADTIIEKLEDKMETIEDNLDKMADMVHSVRDDAERIKEEVHLQVSRARQQTLNKIAAYETG